MFPVHGGGGVQNPLIADCNPACIDRFETHRSLVSDETVGRFSLTGNAGALRLLKFRVPWARSLERVHLGETSLGEPSVGRVEVEKGKVWSPDQEPHKPDELFPAITVENSVI